MSGDLKWNKIFGAGLATVFVILGVNQVSGFVYSSEQPEKMGYFIDAPEEAAGGEAEVELPPDWGTVLPVADVAAGERAFARCAACHTINQGGADGIGPNLYGVVGGPILHSAGFDYSPALREHAVANPNWTYDELDQFITAPSRHVRGTKMSFAGIRNTEERVALIAYLRSQGSGGYAIPAPDPSRQPGAEEEAPAEGEAAEGEGLEQTPDEGIGAQPDEEATSPAQPAAESSDQN
ncbi:MAG: cytochrome c [Brevundimonas sp.]|jgi:cytochrome c|uniref:c-type cytochrome n=1 Tax=Brevundimonas sp. TaxID=1871086 RepID=UPI0039E49E23